jgi:hypothetical protein
MNWTVTWLPAADASLIALWINAPDRNAVTQAANQIDRDLQRDPTGVGESRPGVARIHICLPLGVLYDVDDVDHTVSVWSVWHVR